MLKQSDLIRDMYDEMIDLGEIPYRANRNAVQAFDVDLDDQQGRRELDTILRGIGPFKAKLREIQNAAQSTIRR